MPSKIIYITVLLAYNAAGQMTPDSRGPTYYDTLAQCKEAVETFTLKHTLLQQEDCIPVERKKFEAIAGRKVTFSVYDGTKPVLLLCPYRGRCKRTSHWESYQP